MNEREYRQHRFVNVMHSVFLLSAMIVLLGLLGLVLMGSKGLMMVAGVGVFLLLMSPSLSTHWMMRLMRARPLHSEELPALSHIAAQLAARADLPSVPCLYILPSAEINAFAAGSGNDTAIAVSSGLLRTLDRRELVGVLAHEVSHLAHGDVRVMALAGLMGRMTRSFALFGVLLLLLNLPYFLYGGGSFSVPLLLLLMGAPYVNSLLLLALSRNREFAADMKAGSITGDPRGLASALLTLERHNRSDFWSDLFNPSRGQALPKWLHSHPGIEERIKRLLSLEERFEEYPSTYEKRDNYARPARLHSLFQAR